MDKKDSKIDESLYSRQLYAIGHDAMKKIISSNILIINVGGLGTEIAKNLILSGVKSVTLYDKNPVTLDDLSSGYYFKKSDIGINRAEVAIKSLSELNPYVDVKISVNDITDDVISKFSTVILTDELYDEQIRVNKLCRDNKVYFVSGMTNGVFGQVFVDFGNDFIVTDVNGEKPKDAIISSITSDEKGSTIICNEKTPHKLQSGEYISFSEVDIKELKDSGPVKVKVIDNYSLLVEELKDIGNHNTNGIITQVKIPITMNFQSLENAIKSPNFMHSDLANFDRPSNLHIAYQVLNTFYKMYNRYPKVYNTDDANVMMKLSKDMSDDIDTNIIRTFSYVSQGKLCPVNSVIGGVIAQEALKSCSNKFCPINQFWYFDSIDSLGNDNLNINDVKDSRYKGQINVFGQEFQQKLMDQKYFVVGSGAIGCELLKNFAMIGLGADKGNIIITDMDRIEKSNLNRQFLFRNNNIGQFKSDAAKEAILGINPNMNIISHQNKVGHDTENIYSDDFFSNLDGVANALDNVDARLYMDSKCVYYGKPLLESGTLGTKGNTQVVIPNLTESYGSSPDPPEESIPLCTLKNFPYKIEHTIQYARDKFEGLFTKTPLDTKNYLKDKTYLGKLPEGSNVEIATNIRTLLNERIPKAFHDCIAIGYELFHTEFRNNIEQLLYSFPEDKEDNGVKFWSGTKRRPTPLTYNSDNDTHLSYVHSFAVLWASIFNIPSFSKEYTKGFTSKLKPREFTPSDNVKIKTNEDSKEEYSSDETFYDIIKSLPKENPNIVINPVEFEKDDDTNFHMEFITSCSNLRATCYNIETASVYKTKGIAGKIIPALATTTSIVAGLVTLELYKLVHGHNKVEKYRNTFMNIALPFITFTEPICAPVKEYKGKKYTLWDHYDVKGDMTLQEFLDYFENEHDMELDTILYNSYIVYGWMINPNELSKRLPMKITEIIEMVIKEPLNKKSVLLSIDTDEEDSEGNPLEVPMVRYCK